MSGMKKGALADLAQPGARLEVRVTPKASRNAVTPPDETGTIRVQVTVMPEDGKANAAVTKLLAKALGVAPGRLRLIRGQTARDKLFEID